ncbi:MULTISPECIES: hypothetical protein [Streptomyces]|uniref:Uncharacterized protein n=2 Tax=Streptomyces TaxID=1883 RepID=A0A2U9NUI8_STRAS|nr:hypothetical protein [Streptomyces actuosus]AWT40919.1 hypothetical protein DMT42_00090 [Streptomyces actuosus]MBM4823439.1 hypothetical protein [Streptomyces actuosus]MBM4826615.1 hypothetical protein [Streptomyces actuosus]
MDDPKWAAVHGYGSGLRLKQQSARRTDPNQSYLLSLPARRRAEAMAALNGPKPPGLSVDLPGGPTVSRSDKGCRTAAMGILYGDLKGWYRASSVERYLSTLRSQRVLDDP